MRTAITIGLAAAAMIAALSSMAGGEPQADADAIYTPYYVRGPRIIHVPQPGDRQANVQANVEANTREREQDRTRDRVPDRAERVSVSRREERRRSYDDVDDGEQAHQ